METKTVKYHLHTEDIMCIYICLNNVTGNLEVERMGESFKEFCLRCREEARNWIKEHKEGIDLLENT